MAKRPGKPFNIPKIGESHLHEEFGTNQMDMGKSQAITSRLVVVIRVLVDSFSIGIDDYSIFLIPKMKTRHSLSKTILTTLTVEMIVDWSLSAL